MGDTSFGGLISGLDTKTVVAQLMSIERRPVVKLQNRKSAQSKLLALYGDAQSKLSAIQSAAAALDTRREFKKVTATSGDTDIFTVSATSSAQAGKHTVKVLALAKAEMEVSQGYAATTSEVGTGTFQITVGSTVTDITITSANGTLEGLRDAINNSAAKVTASIVNDGSGGSPYRLIISADESGTANAITINTSGMSGGTTPVFTDGAEEGQPGQQAADAQLVFDGIAVTKSGNEIDDLLDGVTINLKKVDATQTVDLTLATNVEEVSAAVESFVTAYNDFHAWVVAKKNAGDLKGDMAIQSMDRELRSLIAAGVSGLDDQTYKSLPQVGLRFTREGTLELDKEDFEAALADRFDEVMNLFASFGTASDSRIAVVSVGKSTQAGTYAITVTGVGESFAAQIDGHATTSLGNGVFSGQSDQPEEGLTLQFSGTEAGSYGTVTVKLGIMDLIERKIQTYTDVATGTIKSRKEMIDSTIRSLDSLIARKEEQLARVEERLNQQFTNMEMLLAKMQGQSGSLGAINF